jgi:hypothetical protein
MLSYLQPLAVAGVHTWILSEHLRLICFWQHEDTPGRLTGGVLRALSCVLHPPKNRRADRHEKSKKTFHFALSRRRTSSSSSNRALALYTAYSGVDSHLTLLLLVVLQCSKTDRGAICAV